MPAKDLTRWQQNSDGTWVRSAGRFAEEGINPAAINATAGALEAAAELGVDITAVEGTGKDGKITKADVEAYA